MALRDGSISWHICQLAVLRDDLLILRNDISEISKICERPILRELVGRMMTAICINLTPKVTKIRDDFWLPSVYNMSKGRCKIVKVKLSKEILFNRQVNYFIIEKMWEYMNKGKDKQELYKLLGIDKNMYSRIRTADTYNCVNLENRWKIKNSKLQKVGLSKEVMIGQKQMEVEGITQKEWEEYLQYRYVDTEPSSYRTSVMQLMNKKLKKSFEGLEADKKDKRDIGKLFYFFKYGRAVTLDMPDAEMIDLRDSLNHVSIENMKVCDGVLREEVYNILKEKFKQLDIIIQYKQLDK